MVLQKEQNYFMKGKGLVMRKLFLLIFTFFFYSCTSVETQEGMNAYDYEDEEEEEFLTFVEEDSDEEEMAALSEESFATAQSEELEEREAEDELKEIEDEFAEFADEEAEYAGAASEEFADEPTEEPQEEIVSENVEEDPVTEDSLETAQDEPIVEEQSAGEVIGDVAEVLEGEVAEGPIAEEDISAGEQVSVAKEEPVAAEVDTTQDVLESSNVRITNIRYENEQIHVDVAGGVPSYRSRFNEATKQFIIEIPNAVLMDNLRWPYIMKEFQSGFALLQADQKSENVVRIIIQMRPEESGSFNS